MDNFGHNTVRPPFRKGTPSGLISHFDIRFYTTTIGAKSSYETKCFVDIPTRPLLTLHT